MKIINQKATGAKLKFLREKKGLTVQELAHEFGFNNLTTIYAWESGISLPKLEHLMALASLYGIPAKSLMVYEEKNN